ncbi:MAG: hypothetical protein ACKO3P_05705, partial [Planctomycetaceae bacterium]
ESSAIARPQGRRASGLAVPHSAGLSLKPPHLNISAVVTRQLLPEGRVGLARGSGIPCSRRCQSEGRSDLARDWLRRDLKRGGWEHSWQPASARHDVGCEIAADQRALEFFCGG